MNRRPVRITRRVGESDRRLYAVHATAAAASTIDSNAHQGRGFANATLGSALLLPGERFVVARDQAPVGMMYVGLSGPWETISIQRHWASSDRTRVRAFAGQMALDLLNKKLR